jgi:hypothetical protein
MPIPVVQSSRETAAGLVAQWLEGKTTNWNFEDQWPENPEDPALVEIGAVLWSFYSDYPERPLQTSNLSTERLQALERCLAFLRSDEPYEPLPRKEATPSKPNLLARVFGKRKPRWETLRFRIDPERQRWWPFRDEIQCRAVMKSCHHQMLSTVVVADREKAADLIVQALSGNTIKSELEHAWIRNSSDRAVVDIARKLWRYANNGSTQNTSRLSQENEGLLKRCLAFLRSNEHYMPVSYEEAVPWEPNLRARVTGAERPWETLKLTIDSERERWWPFADETQYKNVLKDT